MTTTEEKRIPRLSSPISSLKDHYEIVVIGSGYGGGIAASRLARANREVCLLERGRERWPGEFPNTAAEAFRELQVHTPDADHGPATGLFTLHADRDLSVVSGCGLGGTSLINANVAFDADPRVWKQPCWPSEIQSDSARLAQARERAWTMLKPEPLPVTGEDRPDPKVAALKDAAQKTGRGNAFSYTPITVAFEDRLNAAGVEQAKCTRCGDCCSGCNIGAKTTTLLTYVADAFGHGATIFTEVSVRHLSRRPTGGWIVHIDYLGVGRERFDGPRAFVTADIVVVSAGVLGSTEILLRSAEDGNVELSTRVGKSFSGNGDVLAFAYDCDRPINGVGWGDDPHSDEPDQFVGPCITGVIDERTETSSLADGHIIEEGAIPGPLAMGMPTALAAAALFDSKRSPYAPDHPFRHAFDAIESLVGGAHVGALARTLTYLVMGHDGADGELALENGRLRVVWPDVADKPTYIASDERLQELTNALGGRYVRDPLWSEKLTTVDRLLNQVPLVRRIWWHPRLRSVRQLGPVRRLRRRQDHYSVMTVHPLGGCAIGSSAETGVVDHASRVFSGTTGTDVYDDLYVMDGSIVPTSLGVNPLLTISTLSERACELICDRKGWFFDPCPAPVTEALVLPKPPVGVQFTETMHGSVGVGPDDSPISFLLTIEIDDVEALVADPARIAGAAGTVSIPALDPAPMTVVHGTFRLFVSDDSADDIQHMEYRLPVVAEDGRRWLITGNKTISERSILHAWRDTTTLEVRLYEGADEHGPFVGSGTMRLNASDFAHQLRTIKATGGTKEQRREGIHHYVELFGSDIFEHYLGVLGPEQLFNRDDPPRARRTLAAPQPEQFPFRTKDGVALRLTRYNGGSNGPVLLAHGMGVSSEIFSTDLIDTNLVEYLVAAQYDVWLLDFRVSTALAASGQRSNSDQIAEFDHPEAVRTVLDATGKSSLQAVVHCYGSNTFVMSMLGGWTSTSAVRSMVCSQVATHLEMGPEARLKAGLHTAGALDALGVDSLTAYVTANSNWRQHLLDDALRLSPVPRGERCNSAVCRRVTFLFSPLYQHANLNDRLHDNLHELFGVVNIEGMEHLSTMVRHGHVVDEAGNDVYLTEENVRRLAVPTLLISGGKNECYHPSSTQSTYELLTSANGRDLYDRKVIPGYGHIDCIFGAHAVDDVYPAILEHLRTT
jgi:cholesterol oxidase